jgi:hypothetical protein
LFRTQWQYSTRASQSSDTTTYHVINGHCDCRDYAKAPHHFCKHRLSAVIARRVQELTRTTLDAGTNGQALPAPSDAPTALLPEAPVSITLKATLHGHEVMVTLRGVDFASVKAQVEQASEWLWEQAAFLTQPLAVEEYGLGGARQPLARGRHMRADFAANLQVFCRDNSGYGCPEGVCFWPAEVRITCGLADSRPVCRGVRPRLSRDLSMLRITMIVGATRSRSGVRMAAP